MIFHHFCLIHKIQNSVQIETFYGNIGLLLAIFVPKGSKWTPKTEFWTRFGNSKLPVMNALWDKNMKNQTLWGFRKSQTKKKSRICCLWGGVRVWKSICHCQTVFLHFLIRFRNFWCSKVKLSNTKKDDKLD